MLYIVEASKKGLRRCKRGGAKGRCNSGIGNLSNCLDNICRIIHILRAYVTRIKQREGGKGYDYIDSYSVSNIVADNMSKFGRKKKIKTRNFALNLAIILIK